MGKIIDLLNSIIWSNALVFLCIAGGLYFSIRTRFVQIRLLKTMGRELFKGRSSAKGVSSFQAFAIAISGRIGTGNIAGVATAIAIGGPGAIFWMWLIAFVGASTAFVEATLGQIYKEVRGGEYRGGPAYYIKKGLGMHWYAVLFAVVTMISCAFFLPGVQSNSASAALSYAFKIDPLYSGIGIAVLLGFIIFGGVKRIAKAAEIIVPFMAIGYILMAIVIISMNIPQIPAMFKLIFSSAFGVHSTFGGIIGSAIAMGVKRGLYSNEAGQGTAPHAAAAAEVEHPAQQGLVQAFSIYIDTIFVCTATALMILFSGLYNIEDGVGGFLHHALPGVDHGPEFTQNAIDSFFPGWGSGFVAVALFFFVFTTLMAYYYMAETNLNFMFKEKINPMALFILRMTLLGTIIFGSLNTSARAWDLGDIGVGMMAWFNFIAILLLQKPALTALKDFERQKKLKVKKYQFHPEKLEIKNAAAWIEKNREENNLSNH
ncbi:MAG TPA: alanine/glycine:cation symporter family protein [Moheibacter sp.]|nr:alanine/glycine:cation symporter family protein [Moheibacter sp.]